MQIPFSSFLPLLLATNVFADGGSLVGSGDQKREKGSYAFRCSGGRRDNSKVFVSVKSMSSLVNPTGGVLVSWLGDGNIERTLILFDETVKGALIIEKNQFFLSYQDVGLSLKIGLEDGVTTESWKVYPAEISVDRAEGKLEKQSLLCKIE